MAPSRRRARSSEPAADLLTSLPPPLLDDILTRLDLRDAVRTSALSRAWRRRWVDLPCLSLCLIGKVGMPAVAVDSVLLRYPGNISNFFIYYLDTHSARRVDDWLIALCNRGVKSINLQAAAFALHSSVFLCTSLVCLELDFCSIPRVLGGRQSPEPDYQFQSQSWLASRRATKSPRSRHRFAILCEL